MKTASLQGLRAFCAVARLGSFKSASEEIFLTASAVSHRIKTLEQQMGLTLFERHTRLLKLTTHGESLLVRVGPLIEQIDSEIKDITGSTKFVNLTVTLPPFFSTELFLPKLTDFSNQHQGITINLDTTDAHPDRHPESSDLSVLLCEEKPLDFESVPLFPLILVPACASSYISEFTDDNFSVLENVTLIIHRSRRNAWKQWFRDRGEIIKKTDNIIVLDSMFAVVRAAEQGLGVALVPKILSESAFVNGTLEKISDAELVTGDNYYLVSGNQNSESPELIKLKSWIIENFQLID